MIVVGRFSFPHEAHIAKANLESAGIESFIADEYTINMQWLYSNAIGGVRLMVNEADEAEAINILQADFSEALDETEVCEDTCPHCGGVELVPHTKGKQPAFLVFILLGFPLFFYRQGYKCNSCGEFSEKL
ncbi:phosphoenolpyruvate synthase [Vibrio breoganii]|uniref:putative signal transducing protein n=1 Tax=Vibrio breoganii TaxID=553239 RepID=UPI000C840AC5|nr:DUF2007 domain-containing protein [Vibrio breoganii]PMK52774.1 phosphoenolpyruvate synthase [Vibrio breoganii]PMK71953.1 phosphoenolpyruvate synthase [Vibrio breoganii]PMO71287.1 phosphoenolpyruvate synthase [Vibrio breoganii]PMO87958.1 phosphoenolpyruvate synthase [Vibrio breoganii]